MGQGVSRARPPSKSTGGKPLVHKKAHHRSVKHASSAAAWNRALLDRQERKTLLRQLDLKSDQDEVTAQQLKREQAKRRYMKRQETKRKRRFYDHQGTFGINLVTVQQSIDDEDEQEHYSATQQRQQPPMHAPEGQDSNFSKWWNPLPLRRSTHSDDDGGADSSTKTVTSVESPVAGEFPEAVDI